MRGQAATETLVHSYVAVDNHTKLGGKALMEARGIAGFKSGMEGFGDVLTDAEIWDILAFIRSTWPDRMRKIQASRNRPHDR